MSGPHEGQQARHRPAADADNAGIASPGSPAIQEGSDERGRRTLAPASAAAPPPPPTVAAAQPAAQPPTAAAAQTAPPASAADDDASQRSGSAYALHVACGSPGTRNDSSRDQTPSASPVAKPHEEAGAGGGGAPGGLPAHVAVSIEEAPLRKPRTSFLAAYLRKFRGGLDKRMAIPPPWELLWSWLGAFLGILAISGANELLLPSISTTLLIPSFGASAVLLFGVVKSPLSQPRNFIGGHIVSATVGCLTRMALGGVLWLSAPVGMSLALLAMQLTMTVHPPGGATALIASSVSAEDLASGDGWLFVGAVAIAAVVMQAVALVHNNLLPTRTYPTFWW